MSTKWTVTKSVAGDCYPESVVTPLGYRVSITPISKMELEVVSEDNKGCYGKCHVHDRCRGHIGLYRGNKLYPTAMCTEYSSICSKVSRTRYEYIEGDAEYAPHAKCLVSSLRTKRGILRGGVTSMVVEGSMRMVIIPRTVHCDEDESVVGVPRFVANSIRIPEWATNAYDPPTAWRDKDGPVTYRDLRTGDKAILIRYPTLWSGGMLAVTVVVEEDSNSLRSTSISVPIELTKSYNADFDGDEMVLIPVTTTEAIAECDSILGASVRPFSKHLRKGNIKDVSSEYNSFLFRTTITATELHEICDGAQEFPADIQASGVTRASGAKFIDYAYCKRTFDVVYEDLVKSGRSFIRKSGGQSNTGYNTRVLRTAGSYCGPVFRAAYGDHKCTHKLGSLTGSVMTSILGNLRSNSLYEHAEYSRLYGYPAIRALSKLGQKMMQSTLSKKDGLVVSTQCIDPIMEIINGEVTKCLVFYSSNGNVMPRAIPIDAVIDETMKVHSTASPTMLSYIVDHNDRMKAAWNGVSFLTCHCGCNLESWEQMAVADLYDILLVVWISHTT